MKNRELGQKNKHKKTGGNKKIFLYFSMFRVRCLQIVVHVLDVFLFVELFEEAFVGLAGILGKCVFLVRPIAERGVFDRDGVFFEGCFDGFEIFGFGINDKHVAVAFDVFGAGVNGEKFDVVDRACLRGGKGDDADILKEIPDRRHLSADFFEDCFDVREGAVFIVGCDKNHHGDVSRSVRFIDNFLYFQTFLGFSRAALDCAVDAVFGHVDGSGTINGKTQTHVHLRITSAFARGDADEFAEFGEDGGALGIGQRLFVFDTRPMRMSGHRDGNRE